MQKIKLIVTGNTEEEALHTSLKQYFPDIRNGKKVEWDSPRKLSCATSHKLRDLTLDTSPSQPMQKLAQAMLDEVMAAKNGKGADLVIVIDDVEIGNIDQENIVATHFKCAIKNILSQDKYKNNIKNTEILLREKCSFHLLKPMVESYLFGDPDAFRVAGVPDGVTPLLLDPNVEQFESNDPLWLPVCYGENEKIRKTLAWWYHEKHPKHYLKHLTERNNVFYDEKIHGKKALENLSWGIVPKCQQHTPFIRSLFQDIADWFEIKNPLGNGQTNPYFYPDKKIRRDTLLLRNM